MKSEEDASILKYILYNINENYRNIYNLHRMAWDQPLVKTVVHPAVFHNNNTNVRIQVTHSLFVILQSP